MAHVLKAMIICALLLTACGSDDIGDDEPESAVSFGGEDQQCPSVKLANEADDQQVLQEAIKCFLAVMESGDPIVMDVDRPTVEGDSIFYRYDFDGASVLLVRDTRLDTFGAGAVEAERCESIVSTNGLPEGVQCTPVDHPGFVDASQ